MQLMRTMVRAVRRRLKGISGDGNVSMQAKFDGHRSNIFVEAGALVHEHAWLSCTGDDAKLSIGSGTAIKPYAQLATENGFIKIGKNCSVNSFCILNGAGGLTIGDEVRIGAQTAIIAGNHGFDDPTRTIYEQQLEGSRRGITIGNDVWIGIGATIVDGVTVGSHSVLASGTVVTEDVPENSIVAGVPGRVLRRRGEPARKNS